MGPDGALSAAAMWPDASASFSSRIVEALDMTAEGLATRTVPSVDDSLTTLKAIISAFRFGAPFNTPSGLGNRDTHGVTW